MFTNAKEVRINNKIVKSIKTVGDNMTLYINAYLKSGDLTLLSDKEIIQVGERSNLQALLNTGEAGVRVNFFEVLTPAINLTVDKNIIQVGERVNLTTKVKDEAKNTKVYFYAVEGAEPVPPTPTPVPTTLTLTSDKDILSYYDSDSAVLSATVKDQNGEVMSGQSVVFKKGSEVLATKTTDSVGVASYTYASQGVGDVTLTVECMNLQETYTIEDCDYYADSTKISDWSNVSSGGTAFKKSTYAIGLTNYSVEIQFNTINAQIIVGSESNWVAGVSFVSSPYYLYTHSSSGGTVTDVISSPTASDIWRLEIEGTTIRLYRNDNLYTTKTNCKVDYPTNLRLYPQNKSSNVDYVKIKPL